MAANSCPALETAEFVTQPTADFVTQPTADFVTQPTDVLVTAGMGNMANTTIAAQPAAALRQQQRIKIDN
jgi:hypothetical protein